MKSSEKISGTCQACFGGFALKGTARDQSTDYRWHMVLHGYERPGLGYTIGRCWGVDQKPYELDVEVTKGWRKEVVKNMIPGLHKAVESVQAATELSTYVNDYKRGYSNVRRGTYHQIEVKFIKGAANMLDEHNHRTGLTFETLQEKKLHSLAMDIENLEMLVKELDRRIKHWVYAPEKLVKEERKGPLVHESRGGNQSWAAVCRMSYSARSDLHTTQDPTKVTCPKCIARRK